MLSFALARAVPCAAQPSLEPRAAGVELSADDLGERPEARALAQFLLARAKQRFNRGVLEKAPAELEAAFDLLSLGRTLELDPAFAFNAARVARELGHCQEARLLYQQFLELERNPERRQRAEQRLGELAGCDAFELTTASSVLPGVALGVLPAPWQTGPARPLAWTELEPAVAAEESEWQRPLCWSLLGGAGVSAVLSTIFAVQAASKDAELERFTPDPTQPDAAPAQIAQLQSEGRAAQTRARVFGAIAAGLGVAAGVGFWVSSRDRELPASELTLQTSSNGARAYWQHRF